MVILNYDYKISALVTGNNTYSYQAYIRAYLLSGCPCLADSYFGVLGIKPAGMG